MQLAEVGGNQGGAVEAAVRRAGGAVEAAGRQVGAAEATGGRVGGALEAAERRAGVTGEAGGRRRLVEAGGGDDGAWKQGEGPAARRMGGDRAVRGWAARW